MRKFFILAGVSLAFGLGFVLTRHKPDGQGSSHHSAPATEVHGELIEPVAAANADGTNQSPTNNLTKRRHPKPPPVQVRMVMAQIAPSDQSGGSGAAIASGTRGTAADLARTNLVSAGSLPPIDEKRFGCPEVSFRTLASFDLRLNKEMTNGAAAAQTVAEIRAQIPSVVQALDGRKVLIQGFLLPVTMDEGLAVEFLLMRNQSMCCYGVPPKINEWITVKMKGKGVNPIMDQPIAVIGTLRVGPILENGLLTGIYSVEGEKTIGP